MYQAGGSIVETGSRKIKCNYMGTLILFKAMGPNQLRLNAGTIWTTKGNVNNLADLR